MCRSMGPSTSRGEWTPIQFGSYNIQNGWKDGLDLALRWMYQVNMDLGILQETNIADIIYIYGSSGYSVVTMNAPSRHCSGVAVFYQA